MKKKKKYKQNLFQKSLSLQIYTCAYLLTTLEDMTTYLASQYSQQVLLTGFYGALWEFLESKCFTGMILTMKQL